MTLLDEQVQEVVVYAMAIAEARDRGSVEAEATLVNSLIESVRPLRERILVNELNSVLREQS